MRMNKCPTLLSLLLLSATVTVVAQTSNINTENYINNLLRTVTPNTQMVQVVEQICSSGDNNACKMSSELLQWALTQDSGGQLSLSGQVASLTPNSPVVEVNGKPYIPIEAVATDTEAAIVLLDELQQLGLINGNYFEHRVGGLIPTAVIWRVVDFPSLLFLWPSAANTNVGITDSQGDRSITADRARRDFNVDGRGVTIGTISNSFDCRNRAETDVIRGDLPPGIVVLKDLQRGGTCNQIGTDEGRAMMQIIADVAPGTNQAFHTGAPDEATFANAILNLRNQAGSDIIVDDLAFFDQPFFQPSIAERAINQVVADGAAYFSAAGNSRDNSYESPYRPSGQNPLVQFGVQGDYEAHDFDPGPGVDVFQKIKFNFNPQPAPGTNVLVGRVELVFQWDEPFRSVGSRGSTSDLDIFLFDDPPTQKLLMSTGQNIGRDAIERLAASVNPDATFNLVIARRKDRGGSNPNIIKYVNFRDGIPQEFRTNGSTIRGHQNSVNAEAVGAADYRNTPVFGVSPARRERFSSVRGTTILFDTNGNRLTTPRTPLKPNIVAADNGNTNFFGVDVDNDGFPNFPGTSASAPHAAAAAALLLQRDRSLTPQELYLALEGTAADMDRPGIDDTSGFGFINTREAVRAVGEPPRVNITANGDAVGNGYTIAEGNSVFLNALVSDSDGLGFPVFARNGDNNEPISFIWNFAGANARGGVFPQFEQHPVLSFAPLAANQNSRRFNIALRTIDGTGVTTQSSAPITLVRPTPPTVQTLINGQIANQITVAENAPVFLDNNSSDSDGLGFPILAPFGIFRDEAFLWNFDGGIGNGRDPSLRRNPAVTFPLKNGRSPSRYNVKLTVIDKIGSRREVGVNVTAVRATPPTVTVLGNGQPAPNGLRVRNGATVQFRANAQDSDELGYPILGGFGVFNPVPFLWNFDGGVVANQLVLFLQQPSATFNLPQGVNQKTFNVRVTVTDKLGASTVGEISVVVTR